MTYEARVSRVAVAIHKAMCVPGCVAPVRHEAGYPTELARAAVAALYDHIYPDGSDTTVKSKRKRYVPHNHTTHVVGCFRCDISKDENPADEERWS